VEGWIRQRVWSERPRGGSSRPAIELRNHHFRVPTLSYQGEGHAKGVVMRETLADTAESENLSMRQHSNRENREIPEVPMPNGGAGRLGKVNDHTPNMHASGKSDGLVVPTKQANKTGPTAAAEPVEGRRLAKGNTVKQTADRTQSRQPVSYGLHGVRKAATFSRHHPRQEPYEVVPRVRIRAGGGPKGPSLPRLPLCGSLVFARSATRM